MPLKNKDLNILIVEDNLRDFLLIENFLLKEISNSQITHTQTFSETKNIASTSNKFDIIFLDISLPDTIEEDLVIQTVNLFEQTPIILLTSYLDKQFGIKALSLGISDYLLKDELSASLLSKSIAYSIERNRINIKLKDSEEKYRNLFHFSPIPMWVYEMETYRFLDVNEAAIRHYGFTQEEFLSMSINELFLEKYNPEPNNTLNPNTYDTLFYKGEFKHKKKNGAIIQVEIQSNNIIFNDKRSEIVLAIDITKKKEEEQKLKLLESVITNATDSILITEAEPFDIPGPRIIYVNDAFTRMTGYTIEDVIGKTPRILQGPKTDRKILDKLRKALNNWESCEVELMNYKKNGEEFWVNFTVVPVANEKGWFTHWIAIERDTTLRKKNEQEKEQLIQELTQNIGDLRQFAYITSHNLRAPLSNLIGLINLLEDIKINDEALSEILEGFKISTNHLNDTVEDLIQILLIKDNKPKYQSQVPFNEVLQKVLFQIKKLINAANPDIEYNFSDAPSILFNSIYLESIFLNLLTNAIKYRSPSRNLKIFVRSKKVEQEIHLEFQDNGIGINLDRHKEKIFGLYQRFHKNTDSKGIGLFLIKSQLEALGAKIEVESKVDVGTKFLIKFKDNFEND
ncbi:MAG: PAS domain S-box protein [Leptospiraceae bacterium]|nr:PAS domain S-box protein [Leptospiraceae bacterium]